MFKKKDGTEVDEAAAAPEKKKLDEAAYEDSWYRSLKAMAETLGVEGPEDDEDDDDVEPGSEA